ncbi:MAG: succinate dehydrogenase, hydrophobic membrane anchor protein [Methylococcaceae bacterium]|jgi:succinate dehydrogenase / fumarate reductase membrane anchor subunit|nr:succinate dehydrogenase, hydrophobic membrane anchor protein [Methylococcaceae bacterium]MDD1631255.1 succinate dehydrogenase, hydrophobic membrane anchor protein [Methylococcaceae bacterium]MDD1644463.1 succinate dehydrogenase, hydrophobic membrane anchor protein [Methylococcaceae bacterium]
MDYRTPLAKVRGLGSAKAGTSHWWMQRITAVALIPLSFWLISFLDLSLNAPYQQTVEWLTSPLNTVCMVAWVLAVFYHAAMGLQVVIEDYVAAEGVKIVAVWTVNLSFLMLALAALIAVFRTLLIG